MTELIGGQIDISDQSTNTTEQIQCGTIKAHAVAPPARQDLFPGLAVTDATPAALEAWLMSEIGRWALRGMACINP